MRLRAALPTATALLLTCWLVGCSADAAETAAAPPTSTAETAVENSGADDAALAQAQAWLDAANLPPGAVRSENRITGFGSFTGWPCGPTEQLEGFWTVPDTSVADAAGWLRENPPADLISTAVGPPYDPQTTSAIIGYIPEPEAQEGIVYTVGVIDDVVTIRAEVAALTESGSCPPLPDGGTYGAPGQG